MGSIAKIGQDGFVALRASRNSTQSACWGHGFDQRRYV